MGADDMGMIVIAVVIWLIGAACGIFGLWIGAFRHENTALYIGSLILAAICGWLGAAVLSI